MKNDLNMNDIKKIKEYAREKLGLCRKSNDIIGEQIFSILSLYARVIYYPLGKNGPWGFTRLSGTKNDLKTDKPFVAINSSISRESQIFAAAHELYHIWYEQGVDILPSDLLEEKDKEISEKKANRFAAEFLVDEQLLRQEIELYGIEKYDIKNVLKLTSIFSVPYRTIVKRLMEIKEITASQAEKLLSETEESIKVYRKRYSIQSTEADERIVIDNLTELAVNAYEKKLITYEKFEYLLRINNMKPEDLGIMEKNKYSQE